MTAPDYIRDRIRVTREGDGCRVSLLAPDCQVAMSSPHMPLRDALKLAEELAEDVAALVTAAVSQEAHR